MKLVKWSQKEVDVIGEPISAKDAAKKIGRSLAAVNLKRQQLGISVADRKAKLVEESSYETDQNSASEALWERRYTALAGKYQKAIHENTVTLQLVSEIKDLAPVKYSPLPKVQIIRKSGGDIHQSAVLLFSDTHVGKVVEPSQTLGFGEYNFEVFLARLKFLEESVVSIIQNHINTPLDELVIAMLGDMLDGNLNHAVEAGQHLTLFSQYYSAGHAIAQFFRNLAAVVPKIRVKTCVGNHTRWGTQRKMPTDNRFSNLDMFLYAFVEALTSDIKNIEWSLDCQPFTIFEVQSFTFKASHGDHLRGGDKALGIPNHSIGREISTTSQLFNKHGRQAPHYYVCGHLHRGIQLPHALGEVVVNGGFPGLDNYALAENFNPVDPMQRLLFVHPKYGRTAEYPLGLKFAEAGEKAPYEIPKTFTV